MITDSTTAKASTRRVEAEVHGHRQLDRAQRPDQPPRKRAAGHTAGQRQQEALGQQVSHHQPARGADRQPDGHFLRAGGSADEQQSGQVAAGDGQHQADHCKHQRGEREQHRVHLRVDAHVVCRVHADARARVLVRDIPPPGAGPARPSPPAPAPS